MLSGSEVALYRSGISSGRYRVDGRTLQQRRETLLSTGTLKHTPGSASITIDNTSVLVAVQAKVSVDPFPIQFLVDYAPSAKISASELVSAKSRLLQDLFISAYSTYGHFAISQEEGYWQLNVDVMVLNDAGNVFEAAFKATAAALGSCRLPKNVSSGALFPEDMVPLPISVYPTLVYAILVNNTLACDPTLEEEHVADAQLFAVPNATIRKTGRGLFDFEQLAQLMALSNAQS